MLPDFSSGSQICCQRNYHCLLLLQELISKSKMMKVIKDAKIAELLPQMAIGTLSGKVKNYAFSIELWKEIEQLREEVKKEFTLETIKNQPQICSTREAYRKLGKDPNRYRPSSDALLRRVVKNMELYQISVLVDIINLVSMKTGYSIGGFDADKIVGEIKQGIGKHEEPYQGIGRGDLNIENIPLYRDDLGAIGNPTSDHIRTSISLDTTHLFLIVNCFSGDRPDLEHTLKWFVSLLEKYASGKDLVTEIY